MAVIIQAYDKEIEYEIRAILIISFGYEAKFDEEVKMCIDNNNFEEFCSHKYIINNEYIDAFTVTKRENGKESICSYVTIIKVCDKYSHNKDCALMILSDDIIGNNTIDNKIIELSEVTTPNRLSLMDQAINRVCNNDEAYCQMMRNVKGNNNFELYISPYDKQKIVTNNINHLFRCEHPGQYIIALNGGFSSKDVGYISLPDDFNISNGRLYNKVWCACLYTLFRNTKFPDALKCILDTIPK